MLFKIKLSYLAWLQKMDIGDLLMQAINVTIE
jgi:hypothetical protein